MSMLDEQDILAAIDLALERVQLDGEQRQQLRLELARALAQRYRQAADGIESLAARPDLALRTTRELKALAAEQRIPSYWLLSKADLIKALSLHQLSPSFLPL
jgi:hypothetical protein